MTARAAPRPVAPPIPHRYLSRGYAAGSTESERWLIIWGSAYDGRLVYATKEEAEERADWLRALAHHRRRGDIVTRYVSRHGDYYLIDPEPEATS